MIQSERDPLQAAEQARGGTRACSPVVDCPRAEPQPAEAQKYAHPTVIRAIRLLVDRCRNGFREIGLS
jgi:hypothetical protein